MNMQSGAGGGTTGIIDRVRTLIDAHGQLGVDVRALAADGDLYDAGMTSRASVSLMLALENEFDVEFPDEMLRRDVFQTLGAIASAIETLLA